MPIRKPQSAPAKNPTSERLFELVATVEDPNVVLGPIDQQDLREALIELLALRNVDAILEAKAPQVQAA